MKFRVLLIILLLFGSKVFGSFFPGFQTHDSREYYNLGLKYAQKTDFPMSILYFKRAHLLRPLESRYTLALNKVRSLLTIPPQLFEPGAVEKIILFPFYALGLNGLLFLGIFCLFLGSVFLSLILLHLNLKIERYKLYSYILIGIGIMFLLFSGLLFKQTFDSKLAVVVQDAKILQTPNEDAEVVSKIRSGFECRLERSMGNFYLLKSVDGQEGWIEKSQVKKVW